jgi:hypothetical protein
MTESLDVLREMTGVKKKATTLDELRAQVGPEKGYLERGYDLIRGAESEGYPELGTSGESLPALKRREEPIRWGLPAIKELEQTQREKMGMPPPQGEPALNPAALKLAGAYATQVDPKAIADIATSVLHGSEQGEDKYGNPTLTFEGKTYYINAPGASQADAFQLLGQMGAYAPATRGGAMARSLFKRMLTTGLLSTGTSAALDVAGGQMGSEQGVDLTRAMMTGVIGGAMEGIAPALKVIWRKIFKSPKFFDPTTGKLTPSGMDAARNAGLDPVDMDRKLSEAFAKEAMDEPVPALAITRARESATGIPYTRGQQLAQAGDTGQQAIEDAMLSGTRGRIAKEGLESFERAAEKKVATAVDETLGGRGYETLQEMGEPITSGVQKAERAKAATVREAYEEAAPLLAGDRVSKPDFSNLMQTIKEGERQGAFTKFIGLDPAVHPLTINTYRRLGRLFKKAKKADDLEINEVNLLHIEQERQLIGKLLETAKGADRSSLLGVKRSMDDWFGGRVDDVLFEGDEAALRALLNARKRSSEYKGLYTKQRGKVPDDVGAIIEKILHKDPTPEMTINYIFGAGALGRKQTSANTVKRLKEILGEDSEGWAAMKEAAWNKITKSKTGPIKSYESVVDNFDEVMTQNKSLINELFSAEEQTMMRGIRDAIEAKVSSGAPRAEMSKLRDALKWFLHRRGTAQAVLHRRPLYGGLLHRLGTEIPAVGSFTQTGAVRKATTQIPKPKPAFPMAVSTVIAGSRLANPEREQ